MTFKLSPSSLALMEECPRCFWLHFHGKKRPEGIFPSLPNGMDSILKKHFDKFCDKKELPPELKGNKECMGCRLFDDKELVDEWRDSRRGIKWQDDDGNVLCGAIDNILVKNNKLIVLDYKTRGYPLKDNTHEYYQNQLGVYSFLLMMNGHEIEDYAFLLFYVPKEVLETGEIVFDTVLKKIKIDIKNAGELWKDALKLLNGHCPSKECSEGCKWCELFSE